MQRGDIKLVILAVWLLRAAAPATAAGIDCSKANSPIEMTICEDPKLLRQDGELFNLYKKQVERLAPQARELFSSSQKEWLEAIDQRCLTEAADGTCLEKEYGSRIHDLKKMRLNAGPYVFNTIHHYRVWATDVKPTIVHSNFPQIDRPKNQLEKDFNSFVRSIISDADECDQGGEVTDEQEVEYAEQGVAVLSHANSSWCDGAHYASGHHNHMVVDFQGRPKVLQNVDVFDQTPDARKRLRGLFIAATSFEPNANDDEQTNANNLKAITDFSNWKPSPKGLEFGYFEQHCSFCSDDYKTIPWSDIKPLLPPNSPLWRLINAQK